MGLDYTSYYFVPRLARKQGKIIDIKNGVYKLDFDVNNKHYYPANALEYVTTPTFLEKGKAYYVVNWDGEVHLLIFQDTEADALAQRFGNCFETQKEAEQAKEKIKALLLSLKE